MLRRVRIASHAAIANIGRPRAARRRTCVEQTFGAAGSGGARTCKQVLVRLAQDFERKLGARAQAGQQKVIGSGG